LLHLAVAIHFTRCGTRIAMGVGTGSNRY